MKELHIALSMISKDNESSILKTLESTQGVFDSYHLNDTGSKDKTVDIFKQWCEKNKKESTLIQTTVGKDYPSVEVHGVKMLADFGAARNDVTKLARESGADFMFWIDTDDELVNPEAVKAIAAHMREHGVMAGLLKYEYAKDSLGKVIIDQRRERLIDLSYPGGWKYNVHENYVVELKGDAKLVAASYDQVVVTHNRTEGASAATGRRNHLILMNVLEEKGLDNLDEKELNDLAFDHYERKEYTEALKYYQLLSEKELSTEKRNEILGNIADSHFRLGDAAEAAKYATDLITSDPTASNAYLILAQIFASYNNFQLAEKYSDIVIGLGAPKTIGPVMQLAYTVIPLKIKIHALILKKQYRDAREFANKLLKETNFSADSKRVMQQVEDEGQSSDFIEAIKVITNYSQDTNDVNMMKHLISLLPKSLEHVDILKQVKEEVSNDLARFTKKVKLKGSKDIRIWAGPHYEQWDGGSDTQRGIGGSEGMCIQLSKELAKLGNNITVYNESNGGEFDGVVYANYRTFNPDDKHDVFISLRDPKAFDKVINAKKQYLWLHDTEYGQVSKSSFYAANKIIVLSDYHKEIIKQNHGLTNDNKFWVTRNGILMDRVLEAEKKAGERKPYQLIYASSYDRGLDNFLSLLDTIKEHVPEVSAKIFYGWNTYDAMMEARKGTQTGQYMKQNKDKILSLLEKHPEAEELGRIPQHMLYQEFAESSVWFYPTNFTEISCINAMTAQSLGAVPVCTPIAALNETVNADYGIRVPLEKTAQGVIHLLNNQEELADRRQNMIEWARKQFDMTTLAKEWDAFFNKD